MPQFAHIPSSSLFGEQRDHCILDISWWYLGGGGGEKTRPFTASAWKFCLNLSFHQLLLVELQPAQLMPLLLRQGKQPAWLYSCVSSPADCKLTHVDNVLEDLGPLVLLFLAFAGHVSTIFLWKQEYSMRSVVLLTRRKRAGNQPGVIWQLVPLWKSRASRWCAEHCYILSTSFYFLWFG